MADSSEEPTTMQDDIAKAMDLAGGGEESVETKEPVEESTEGGEKPAYTTEEEVSDDKGLGDKGEESEEDTESVELAPKKEEKPVRDRAPESWKPSAREHWAKLPSEVKLEIQRRERDTSVALQRSSEARKFADQFGQVIRPFESFIAAERSTPLAAVQNLMATAASLRVGTPAQKAQTVATIIQQYGVDITALAESLEGKVPQGGGASPDIVRLLDERLAPVQQFISSIQTQQRQRTQTEQKSVADEISAFSNDPKNEFFEDLRDDMSVLISTAAQTGRSMSLTDAYIRAAQFHPEISKILDQRSKASEAAKEAERIRKKKEAGSSIRGTPGAGSSSLNNKSTSVADDIRAAVEAHSK